MSPSDNEKTGIDNSRVREHLANERTYLAWVRIGISLLGRFIIRLPQHEGHWAGGANMV